MKVILKQDVENLGRRGDIIDVRGGFGRNYLIPRKMALEVTSSNMKMIEIERQALLKKIETERLSYQDLIQKLNQTALIFKRKAGEKDIIFGSVSSSDIKDALTDAGIEIDKKKILLDEPIKRLGNYSVAIKVFHEDRAEIKIEVVKEGEEEAKEEDMKDVEVKKEESKKEAKKKEKEEQKEEKEKKDVASVKKLDESRKEEMEPEKEEVKKEEEEQQEESKKEAAASEEKLDKPKEEEVEPEKEKKKKKDEGEKKETA